MNTFLSDFYNVEEKRNLSGRNDKDQTHVVQTDGELADFRSVWTTWIEILTAKFVRIESILREIFF
jgi:hypothetical protein